VRKINKSSSSLVDLFREALALDELKRSTARHREAPPDQRGDVVSPRDERGIRYRGDFPNPSGSGYRGCF
jgi:hypothetical protein